MDTTGDEKISEARFNDLRVRVIADNGIDVEVRAILISDGHDAVVGTFVLRVAYSEDGIRFSIGEIEVATEFIFRVEEAFAFDGLVHIEGAPVNVIHDVALFMVELSREAHAEGVVEVRLIVEVKGGDSDELSARGVTVLHFEATEYIPDRPAGCYMEFFALSADLTLTEVSIVDLPEFIEAFLRHGDFDT
jgi:hypothetical protein